MREELEQQRKENDKIRQNCELQQKAMQLQWAAVKLQQETADMWRAIELSLACRVKATHLIEQAAHLKEHSQKLRIRGDRDRAKLTIPDPD